MIVYRGGRRQRGYGIGGVFSSFFRKALPFLEKSALSVGKHALGTVSNVLSDVEHGERDIARSIKRHGKKHAFEAGKEVGSHAIKRASEWNSDTFAPTSKRRRRSTSDEEDYDDIFS